ncbi:MAG TPA: YqaA family protein [Rhizomicrobium sp.]|nr:YqaA family protein [Rhizomicrobium sp.]HKY17347.1 YqaA family protein [Rhizomicrobium sp.]
MTFTDPPAAKAGIVRALYDWMMRNAKGKHAWRALGAFTFAEASFFPIPTDIMLIPMVMADRGRAWALAAWCTLWSVLGGIVGYAIGAFLFDTLGQWLVRVYGMGEGLENFHDWYALYGAWAILIKGFLPIPYKIVTIASGFAHYSFAMFVLLSVITRGGRYFLVAGLLYWKGDQARRFIEKRLEASLAIFLAAVVLGFVAVKYLF